jgi:hypothetical protein
MDSIQQASVLTKSSRSIAKKELDGFIGKVTGFLQATKFSGPSCAFQLSGRVGYRENCGIPCNGLRRTKMAV